MAQQHWKLSEIIRAFRQRYHLSKARAAEVLGVSVLYVRSLEEGVDVKSGMPFRPREATLRQLALKMTEFGYPVEFSELADAASSSPDEQTSKLSDVSVDELGERKKHLSTWIARYESDHKVRSIKASTPKERQDVERLNETIQSLKKDLVKVQRELSSRKASRHQIVGEGELRHVIDGLRKRYPPTEDEWAVIDDLDRIGTWHGGFSQPGFWDLTPEEREADFFYLRGLIREYKKRHSEASEG